MAAENYSFQADCATYLCIPDKCRNTCASADLHTKRSRPTQDKQQINQVRNFFISGSSAEPDPRCLGMDPLSKEFISKTGSHLAAGYRQAAHQIRKFLLFPVLLQNLIQDVRGQIP